MVFNHSDGILQSLDVPILLSRNTNPGLLTNLQTTNPRTVFHGVTDSIPAMGRNVEPRTTDADSRTVYLAEKQTKNYRTTDDKLV